jgi:hypothetical protein
VARPYRLTYTPQNGVTCQTGVPLDFSDRSVGAVIYDLSFGRKNADGKRKFTPLRSFLFAGPRFAEGAVKLMTSPPAVQRRIRRFFSEPAFDPDQPLYREFVMRASRMKRPFSPDYVPSKEYLELVSC